MATDAPWTTVAEVTDGVSDENRVINFTQTTAKQIRIRAFSRTTIFGYSIWDWQCFAQPTVVSTSPLVKNAASQTKTVITPCEIKFFAPGISGCVLYDVTGRTMININQQAAPSLTLNVFALRGKLLDGVAIAKIFSKNGTSTQRLTLAK